MSTYDDLKKELKPKTVVVLARYRALNDAEDWEQKYKDDGWG